MPEPDEVRPPARQKKNRKRWCRGKVGVPHQWEKVREWDFRGAPRERVWEDWRCTECGRKEIRTRPHGPDLVNLFETS